jgi:hypothetical protein
MVWVSRRRRTEAQLTELRRHTSDLSAALGVIQRRLEALDNLIRDLHTDSWNANALRTEAIQKLITQNHADTWDADEKRALSLADVVLISIAPQIESLKRDLIALVGEKAVEVFREVSHHG